MSGPLPSYINNKTISNNSASLLDFGGKSGTDDMKKLLGYLRRGGASKPEAQQISEIINKNTGFTFTADHLNRLIEAAYQAQQNAEASLAELVRAEALSSPGVFLSSDVAKALGLSSRVDMQNLSRILARMVEAGEIERGKRRGEFRVVGRTEEAINWREADAGDGLPIKWPLGLESRFETMPGSVIIVAGESNAGKTAFALNVAFLNLTDQNVYYFGSSNEVNARVLRKRIASFGRPLYEWDRFNAVSRHGDFQDVIRPDSLNIIDYLELHSDFFEIGGKIAQIAEKLKEGICVICLQKNPGADFGRGGAMTLDKATAYISLHRGNPAQGEPHTLKLPKLKYPVGEYADRPVKFKLGGGHRFTKCADKYDDI